MNEAAEIFVGMQNSDNTKRAYRNDINKWVQFLATVNVEETPAVALAFKEALVSNYSASTAQRVWCTVAAFYGWMKGTGRIEATPFHGIKSPSRPTDETPPVPTDEDVKRLLDACSKDATHYGSRSVIIINLLLNGLRASEVSDATWDNLVHDTDNNQWILNVLGKGDKWRAVPLTSGSQQAIFDHYLNHARPEKYIVANTLGQQLNVKAIWRTVDWFAAKANVTGMHPHALRHHYATRLVRAGVDIFTLQKLLGHKRADTTQRYVGLDYSDLSKALVVDPMHNQSESHNTLIAGSKMFDANQVSEQIKWDEIPVPF